jgi:hypothetical protein
VADLCHVRMPCSSIQAPIPTIWAPPPPRPSLCSDVAIVLQKDRCAWVTSRSLYADEPCDLRPAHYLPPLPFKPCTQFAAAVMQNEGMVGVQIASETLDFAGDAVLFHSVAFGL